MNTSVYQLLYMPELHIFVTILQFRGSTKNQKLKLILKKFWKSFQSDEEWRLFYCNSVLVCRVIQDFGLCKLDEL